MKHFLSFGCGVNSVALYLYMWEKGIDFEAVFCNHGADFPKTYQYLEYFNEKVISMGLRPVTIIEGKVKEKNMEKPLSLLEYCVLKEVVPSRMFRWCTEKFKIIPTNIYINSQLEGGVNEKCFMHMGIAADESHRANPPKNPMPIMRNKVIKYLFVEDDIDRAGNIEIIKKYGFEVPPKSGCFICPYAKASEFRKLYLNEPCLYEKVKNLETTVNNKRKINGKDTIYIKDKPIEIIAQESQLTWIMGDNGDLEDIDEGRIPCNCTL